MSRLRDLILDFRECAGLASEADVLDVARIIADCGLRPGIGAYTASGQPRLVEDVESHLRSIRLVFDGYGPVDRLHMVEEWSYGAVWLVAPGTRTIVSIFRRSETDWDVKISISTWSHEDAGVPLEAFAGASTEMLTRIGKALYTRIRPALGILYGVSGELSLPAVVLRRALVVGWRTWYGPAYVEKYGRDLLLGLPDQAELLDDGGVFQALDVDALDLATGKRGVYAGVGAYLTEHDIRPAWPRLPRPKSGATPRRGREAPIVVDDFTDDETSLAESQDTEFQDNIQALLSTVIVLDTGLRVLMLPLPWSELDEARQVIAYRQLLYAVQTLRTRHPDGRVRIEFPEIPADLAAMLATNYPAGGPVSYGLLTDPPLL
ncbi:MAG: hypothetical protein IT306_06675 [Chloroflexi bacterium]|nr:hypothetical protein [Chloroflexota bacterium]